MRRLLIIVRKEFTDTLRDRRTLFVMVVFPLLLFPLLITGITHLQSSQIRKAREQVLRIGIVSTGNARAFMRMISARSDVRVIGEIHPDSVHPLIERDSLDAVIVFAPGFDSLVAGLGAGRVTLYYRFADEYDIARRRLGQMLNEFERSLIDERFRLLRLDPAVVHAVRVEEVDVTPLKEKIGKTVGGFIPYLFVIFCFMGSMYPAIDLAAGEKERGTIETLLIAPVSRLELLLGKFTVVVTTGIASAAVSMVGLLAAVRGARDVPPEFMDAVLGMLDVATVLLVLSLLLPLAAFFASLLLSLSFYARSYKEAQSIISPLTIVVILPVAVGMIPGIELSAVTAALPVLNVSLATKAIIAGTITPLLLAEVYLTLITVAALSLWACTRWVSREETIFRGT